MNLIPFDSKNAAAVAGWPRSAAEVLMWRGLREFPVPAAGVAA